MDMSLATTLVIVGVLTFLGALALGLIVAAVVYEKFVTSRLGSIQSDYAELVEVRSERAWDEGHRNTQHHNPYRVQRLERERAARTTPTEEPH